MLGKLKNGEDVTLEDGRVVSRHIVSHSELKFLNLLFILLVSFIW